MFLITYDVNTEDAAGRKRLRQVAKICQNYGQRVQNSVFEIVADAGKILEIKTQLLTIIDPQKDSLRFYALGNAFKNKIEHHGAKPTRHITDTLIL